MRIKEQETRLNLHEHDDYYDDDDDDLYGNLVSFRRSNYSVYPEI